MGPMGPGIEILGKLNDVSELPASADLGQGYLIAGNFWGWTGGAFEDLGPIQGPKGDQGLKGDKGDPGPKGDQGLKGDKGDQGTLWIVLSRDPGAADGRIGDYFLNSATLQYFRKVSVTLWGSLGYMGGGNVYDAAADNKEYVRYNGIWRELQVTEVPNDGKKYLRINGGWVELVVDEAPLDGNDYLRSNGAWKALDRYTLKVSATNALDLAVQQVFRIDGTVDQTLTIANPPSADRAMPVVIKVLGTGGVITWPVDIDWVSDSAPVLSPVYTVVLLTWLGDGWIGHVGPEK